MRFVPDDGRKADLHLTLTEADSEARRAAGTASVYVTSIRGLSLTDDRGTEPQAIAQTSSLSYITPGPIPFFAPKMDMQGGEDGLQRWHVSHPEPAPDAAQILTEGGLTLAPLQRDEAHLVDPAMVIAFSPTIRALADIRPTDTAAIWSRQDPPAPAPQPAKALRTKAVIEASKQARRAVETKMIMEAVRLGTGSRLPHAAIRD